MLDARLGERQAGAGPPALPVEDRGDLPVGVMDCEPADQLDRVLVGAVTLGAATDQLDAELAARAALPEDLDLGDVLRAADGDDDLADQRAQQLLAVAVGGRLGRPEHGQVARQARQRASLEVGQRRRPGVLERGERALLALDRPVSASSSLRFQGAGDEAVLGLAGVELAVRAVGLELGALEREALAGQPRLVLVLELGDRPGRRGHAGRGDGLEERRGDRLVQPPAAERLAGSRCRGRCGRARTHSAGDRPSRAGIGDLHPCARSARSAAGLAAARRPRGRRRRPRRAVSRWIAGAGGWRGTPPRTHSRDGDRAGRQTTPRSAPRAC